MFQSLYYPHYTPSTSHLRSLLLYSDEVQLIVPGVDQYHVKQREHIAEINEDSAFLNKKPIRFIDPTPHYRAWMHNDADKDAYEKLIRLKQNEVSRRKDIPSLKFESCDWRDYPVLEKSVDGDGHRKLVAKLQSDQIEPWRLIAAQKMPPELIIDLTKRNLAIPLYYPHQNLEGHIIEQDPVLIIESVASFILSRLARTMGIKNNSSTITFSKDRYFDHLYSPENSARKASSALLSFAIPLVIPAKIEALSCKDFIEIRQEFGALRARLGSLSKSLTENYNLDEPVDVATYKERLKSSMADLQERVKTEEKNIARRASLSKGSMIIDVASSITGVLAGYAAGDLMGAVTGGVLGNLAPELTAKLSTLAPHESDELIANSAMMRARIQQVVDQPVRSLPKYLI